MTAWHRSPAANGAGSTNNLDDASHKAARDEFGEGGLTDLIAVSGSDVLLSMTPNVDRSPVSGECKPPLQPLPR